MVAPKELLQLAATKNGKAVKLETLVDSGSPTTFIKEGKATELGLEIQEVQELTFRGVVSKEVATTAKATRINLEFKNATYEVDAYVTPHITNDVILGIPIIRQYPEFATWLRNKQEEVIQVEDIVVLSDLDARITWADKLDDAQILTVKIEEVNTEQNSFKETPVWFQKKYRETVREDLPPRPERNIEVEHDIVIKKGEKLPRLQPYRLTPKLEKEAQKLVADLLEKGFILPSKSPCSSPIVLVKKKDDNYRMCIDYRKLNEVTVKDPFPLPRIEVVLAKIGQAKHFSTLDLHSGYHQIPMNWRDRHKTAFVTPTGKYEYTVMPFGLVNAPSTFARFMADIFMDLPFVCVYLDDILVFSNSENDHWKHLDAVLNRLKDRGLIAKVSKCHFNQPEVEFLGYKLSEGTIKPIQEKCEAINKFPVPKTIKDAQRFLGLLNYYRRFIKDCSKMVKPIQEFVTKQSKWTERQDAALNEAKQALMAKPVLVPFHSKGCYRLTTDASKEGIGAVLEEVSNNKLVGVVGYFSRTVKGPQQNYSAGELELLGIIEASFRPF